MAKLIVTTADGNTQTFALEERNTLGRHPEQSVQVLDRVVSKQHAHVGNALFNIAVNPKSGALYVSNLEARNELRFEVEKAEVESLAQVCLTVASKLTERMYVPLASSTREQRSAEEARRPELELQLLDRLDWKINIITPYGLRATALEAVYALLPLPAPPLPKSKAPPPRPPMLKARPMRKQRSQRGNLLGGTEAIREAKKILHNVRLFGWGNGQNQPRLKVRGHASPCTVGSFSDC